jgi:hypothetical protein
MSYDAFTPRTTKTRLSLPYNGVIYTTRRDVSSEKPLPVIGQTMESELGPAWADSYVLSVAEVPNGGLESLQIVHARIPPEADQLATNWQYSTCSMGGQRFPSVQRTVILLASAVAHDSPARGSAMPVETGSIFAGKNYILMDRSAVSSGMQLEPVFRVERRNYVLKSTMRNIGIDSLNGQTLISFSDIYHALEIVADGKTMAELMLLPSHAFWGIQADGFQRTGSQLSCGWYAVERAQIVGGVFSGGVVACGSFTTNDRYYWPPVLQSYQTLEWERKDGGKESFPVIRFYPEGYDGPCKTEVERSWSKTPFVIPVVSFIKPERIYYSSPYFTANIGECLHGAITLRCDIGNADPVYVATVGTARTFPATNHTTWPPSVVAYDDQEPFRGGYLRTTRRVYSPEVATSGIPSVPSP